MPLTGSEAALAAALQPEIVIQVKAVFTVETPFGDEALEKFAEAVAKAVANKVVPHIVANAVTKTVVANVMAGPATLTD